MTMIPARNLSKQHCFAGYGGSEFLGNFMSRLEGYETCLGFDLAVVPMAEEESRTESVNEAASSSKDERDEGWLQLGIGGGGGGGGCGANHDNHLGRVDPTKSRSTGLVELDLLSGGASQQERPLPTLFHVPEFRAPRPVSTSYSSPNLFLQLPPGSSSMFPQHQDINWAFRPIPINVTVASSSSSSSSSSSTVMPPGSYFSRPFQRMGVDVAAGPSLDFRILDPPRRPQSGIWFMLQASQNQAKEPFLPQIPKSYLRIKDGRMTVRLLMKYLVNKLRLDNESEIEITCRGQKLLPFLTLQHVRDNIWSPRDAAVTLLSDSAGADHLMVLHYARSA